MRTVMTIAVLLAVVATALAGVKEQSESSRLRWDIPKLERRRDTLERRARAAEAGAARALSARNLLLEQEQRDAALRAPAPFPGPRLAAAEGEAP